MITTTFLLLLLSFEFWYLTSKQFKQQNQPVYVAKIIANAKLFRILAIVLFILASASFIVAFGFASGISALIVGLMAAGSLIVVIQPFQYLRLATVAVLYFSILLLEVFI